MGRVALVSAIFISVTSLPRLGELAQDFSITGAIDLCWQIDTAVWEKFRLVFSPAITQNLLKDRSDQVTREHSETTMRFLISPQMAKALANPWRNRILMELHLRPMSPSEFVEKTGGDLANISRYFRQLRDWGFLEEVEERRGGGRRGAIEHVYRAIQRVHFDTATWEELPQHLKEECSGAVLGAYFLRITEALEARTFDAESDRHLSWKAVSFDRQAWTEFVARLDDLLEWLPELEAEAANRIAESGEEPIPATIGLATFRSPGCNG